MTFALFSRVSFLGEVDPGSHAGARQPMLDPSGRPVPEPDDGEQSKPLELQSVSAGFLRDQNDPGEGSFGSTGLAVTLTLTDSRLFLLADSGATGQWAGQVRYESVTDIVVRPRAGRRDPGGVRILFLDPSATTPLTGRQYVDLIPSRKSPPSALSWELLQRIALDRHRRLPPDAVAGHELIEAMLRQGPLRADTPGYYSIPIPPQTLGPPHAEPVPALEDTTRLAAPAAASVVADPSERSPWSPPLAAPDAGSALPRVAAGGMIVAVPGVGRHAGADEQPTTGPGITGSAVSVRFRVELDNGDALVIDSPTLLGRNPAAEPGEVVRLTVVDDSTLSYSKTHLLLTPGEHGITATDRHSTNGVSIEAGGRTLACTPGKPQPLQLPAILRIGSRRITVTAE